MAKRDIPEINAGSMADIAFLLLLFFLVTTTMDKDQAYVRSIPKKIEIPPEDLPDVQKRNILAIKANSQNQLMVRNVVFSDPDMISDFILRFYQTSENKNKPEENFPLYSTATLGLCDLRMAEMEAKIEEADKVGATDMAKFFGSALDEWDKKKKAIKLYGKSELREIDKQAHIRIEVQEATAYAIFTQIHNEIEEAVIELRNTKCKELFGEPYTLVKQRYNQDSDAKDKDILDLIEILYPARIIEVTPKN